MNKIDNTICLSSLSKKKKTNLKRKRKMEIIAYDEDILDYEVSSEQLDILNDKLKTIFEQYYSCDASIDRIMSRNFWELLKIVFFKRKK